MLRWNQELTESGARISWCGGSSDVLPTGARRRVGRGARRNSRSVLKLNRTGGRLQSVLVSGQEGLAAAHIKHGTVLNSGGQLSRIHRSQQSGILNQGLDVRRVVVALDRVQRLHSFKRLSCLN